MVSHLGESVFGRTLSQGGLGNQATSEYYRKQRENERATEQQEQFAAFKNGPGNAVFTSVSNKFIKDWQRNLDFQRQTGLSDEGYRGGYLSGVHRAGFTDEQGMGMTSAIMGAGGSTRAGTGNAGFALQMQRAFGLTNAGQAIGAISGQIGGSQQSKDALIAIQAEGTRLGLNKSDMREENRRFVEMAANAIGQSTATSGAGVDQIIGTLGKFMGTNTAAGQQAGLSAYQAFQAQSNTMGGPSAAMRAAGMLNSPVLNKLNGEEQAGLFAMNQADVNPDDPGIKALAKKAGVSPQALADEYHKVQNSSLFDRTSADQAVSRLKAANEGAGPLSSGEAYGSALSEATDALGNAQNKIGITEVGRGLSRKSQLALAQAQAQGDSSAISKILQGDTAATAQKGETGLAGDTMERLQAQSSRLANELFSQIKDSILPASNAAKEFAKDISELTFAMSRGTAAQKQSALEKFTNSYPGMVPSNQPSAGPPANGGGSQSPGH